MTEQFILVLDEGTTSTRAMLFAPDGSVHGVAQREITQYYPLPGRVEHDAAEIWDKTLACARQMVEAAGGAKQIACIGITNQRETVVAWDRTTGEPLTRAIVWQDRRTADYCELLRKAGHEERIQHLTGLLLDPYFSATKMKTWSGDSQPVYRAARAGRLAFGTIESWLVFKLTGKHITDATNASRTMLLPLEGASWSDELCELFGISAELLPEVVDNAGQLARTRKDIFGDTIAITGLAGDQQAATIGQGCLSPGDTKATYGTGAFVLTNTGREVPRSENRLLGTILCQLQGRRTYAIEGSVFVAGSLVKWLRDALGLIREAAETETLARSVESTGGVVIVPAHSGLGAPYWEPHARGVIAGLSFASGKAEIARAALEAQSHQTADLAQAFAADGASWTSLRIDGGMSANDWMAQDIADILRLPVERPANVETTALGAAMLAGLGAGLFASLEDAAKAMRGGVTRFVPGMKDDVREERLGRWKKAIAAARL